MGFIGKGEGSMDFYIIMRALGFRKDACLDPSVCVDKGATNLGQDLSLMTKTGLQETSYGVFSCFSCAISHTPLPEKHELTKHPVLPAIGSRDEKGFMGTTPGIRHFLPCQDAGYQSINWLDKS